MKIKGVILTILTFNILSIVNLHAQDLQLIQKGGNLDPSFYDITKISDNEYWLGGEYGVLNPIDTTGHLTEIEIPFECSHILRIIKSKAKVFLTTADGQLLIYNLITKVFTQNTFEDKYRKSCFYDILILENGTIYICGGASRIASGKIAYPNGFVLKTSINDNKEAEVIWENKNSFVWSLFYDVIKDNLLISAYSIPFMKSSIFCSYDKGMSWTKEYKIKGIVHDFEIIGDEIWYCGSKSILYFKHGMIGKLEKNSRRIIVEDFGCIYDIFLYNDKLISCNYQGEFYEYNTTSDSFFKLDVINSYPIYSFEMIHPGKLLMVGHGNTIYLYNYPVENKKQLTSD